ncbi:MAG: 1-deoxy-D-xylulose-5-phosphate reductoisomerase [Planctomycetes bacterium]|nr:1-deoxy-D-xylulose-5-phosphate reductoisomerase [Planctomycetota bacterium]
MKRRIAVLGSTGSVGVQALSLIADRQDRFELVLLGARRSAAALLDQARRFRPGAVCLAEGNGREASLAADCAWFEGEGGLLDALEQTQPELVLNAITGAAGLPASEWTLRTGRTLALANKESLVVAGAHLRALAASTGARILPVDSEHCAIAQCLHGERLERVRRIWLTASGGPFRERPLADFASITPAEALRHPTWDMGPRITIGSATMMNKAFEVLEAHWLFGLEPERIAVVVHPQSIVHSMVEFVDGSLVAQLGVPDMRVPILYCLGWPDRLPFEGFSPFDPLRFARLGFEPIDERRFPAIPLAYEVLARGGDSGATLNAADEVATAAFLAGRIAFPAITELVTQVLRATEPGPVRSLDDAHRADRAARAAAELRLAGAARAGAQRVP